MGKGNIPPDIPGFSIPFQQSRAVLNGKTDFAQIQDAVDHASVGDVIQIGQGTFEETVSVTTDQVVLIGTGRSTVIDGGIDGDALTLDAEKVMVQDIAAETTPGQGNDYSAFVIGGNATDVKLRGCRVNDTDQHGYRVEAGAASNDDHVFEGCHAEAGDEDGFHTPSAATEVQFNSCRVVDTGRHGYFIDGPQAMVTGCHAGGVGTNGFNVTGDRITVVGCVSENAGDDSYQTDANGVRFTGCISENPTGDAFAVLAGATGTVIRDPSMTSTGGQEVNDAGTRTVLNGRYVTPPTEDLGGANGSISPTDDNLDHYRIKVDAGGGAVNLQGIDGIAEVGTRATLVHTGGETITVEHNNGGATNPLLTQGLANFDLDANDEQVTFEYDGTSWREVTSNLA